MNGLLLGIASLGARVVSLSRAPAPMGPGSGTQSAADDAGAARLMEAAPDIGQLEEITMFDPKTGERTYATGLGFVDGPLVREVGVEPTNPLGRWILSPLRLPIPPLPRGAV